MSNGFVMVESEREPDGRYFDLRRVEAQGERVAGGGGVEIEAADDEPETEAADDEPETEAADDEPETEAAAVDTDARARAHNACIFLLAAGAMGLAVAATKDRA
eukprot:jgi/Tetstr1/464031/TSEL_008836.t1